MLAVYRSVLDYFYSEKLDWQELEKLTGFESGKAAWSVKILTYLARKGMDIKMIEPFDYKRYAEIGEPYLDELLSKEEKDWNLKHSNLLEIRPLIPQFLKSVKYNCRTATMQDIDDMLNEDRLVFVQLNSRVLNDKAGYFAHAVLIIDKEGDDYIFHDPGLPPKKYRRVKSQKLFDARGGEHSSNEVTGLKLKSS
jgi:hypothetical protein